MNSKKRKRYLWLFEIHFFISMFTFGGGYVVVPMVRKYFVEKKAYFSEEKLMQMAAVAQSSPGAIAINLSALTGYYLEGIKGALISCAGSLLPPLLILILISTWYQAFSSNLWIAAILKGMQAGAAALIVGYLLDMSRMIIKERCPFFTLLMPVSFLAVFLFNIPIVIILFASALFSAFWIGIRRREERE